jgi:CheY-like chemotaxis protein
MLPFDFGRQDENCSRDATFFESASPRRGERINVREMGETKARILHVDDHQDTRLMMAALLNDGGYGVMTAGSVTEALQLAEEIPFDLFILDVRLPDGTGFELCRHLRDLQPTVPVLYYSAYADPAEAETALAECGDAYLRKPVCIADIEDSIAKLLAKNTPA